ncbi:hypothetical protein P171DRAFT_425749 [Karstenula rhodostoma CBS 690.94]|uniref:Uncharacterized protein n=1 Tax=Karstenula rhodostoma CBS 690.94 TaxID=1392251 RepID=A0A9P4PXV7_9PLEO|nr:hypothetical protein P171DRAFT_425749 [Karstenula rhodostoma CBS 690.94]
MSTPAIPLQTLSAAGAAVQPPPLPITPPQQPTPATTPPPTITLAAAPALAAVHGHVATATAVRSPSGWRLVNLTWQDLVALVAVIGFATTMYYGCRADVTGAKGLSYTVQSWFLSAWSAKKDYCEFKRTCKNDTECDPGSPPVKRYARTWSRDLLPFTALSSDMLLCPSYLSLVEVLQVALAALSALVAVLGLRENYRASKR